MYFLLFSFIFAKGFKFLLISMTLHWVNCIFLPIFKEIIPIKAIISLILNDLQKHSFV
jgi:hypothetical protein